jgi:hypothetical protein
MAWTAQGSFLFASSASLTTANVRAGDLLVVSVCNAQNATVYCTALSGGGVTTWTPAGTYYSSSTGFTATVATFLGRVTATGAGSITYTWSGTTPSPYSVEGHEFTSSAGTWAFAQQVNYSGADNAWTTLTPTIGGGLYWVYAGNEGTATDAGNAGGWFYTVDTDGNGAAYNLNCALGVAVAPAFTDTNSVIGQAVLIGETQPSAFPGSSKAIVTAATR